MHTKDIKRIVRNQLKKKFPNWKRLSRKKKKILAKQVSEEVMKDYSLEKEVTAPLNELTGTPAIEQAEIMTLNEMDKFIADHDNHIIQLPIPSRKNISMTQNCKLLTN